MLQACQVLTVAPCQAPEAGRETLAPLKLKIKLKKREAAAAAAAAEAAADQPPGLRDRAARRDASTSEGPGRKSKTEQLASVQVGNEVAQKPKGKRKCMLEGEAGAAAAAAPPSHAGVPTSGSRHVRHGWMWAAGRLNSCLLRAAGSAQTGW